MRKQRAYAGKQVLLRGERKHKSETPVQRAKRVGDEQKIATGYVKAKKREKAAKRERIASWAEQTEALLARRRAQS